LNQVTDNTTITRPLLEAINECSHLYVIIRQTNASCLYTFHDKSAGSYKLTVFMT